LWKGGDDVKTKRERLEVKRNGEKCIGKKRKEEGEVKGKKGNCKTSYLLSYLSIQYV
jgi:hypothetical protein